jgi:hypothetical protein
MTTPSSAIGGFVIGLSPIGGPLVPSEQTTLQNVIPAYVYEQYADDENVQAFFTAYNTLAQQYLDWFNETPLPIYTSPAISGLLLDWVGAGLYGIPRPSLSSGHLRTIGPFNTYAYNVLPLNTRKKISSQNYLVTTDDIYKRIITWNFGKGDGNEFSVNWLKRRVMRFLTQANGVWGNIDQTYPVSVQFVANNQVNITISSANLLDPNVTSALLEGIANGVLVLPFQFTYSVVLIGAGGGFGFFQFGISSF